MANTSSPSNGASAEFDAREQAIADHLFVLQPGYAVFLGLHQYDGRVPDLSRSATERWAEEADRRLARLRDLGSVPADRELDRILLELLLESPLFDLRDARELDRNPMSFLGLGSLTAYMVREYAPLEHRVNAMAQVLEAVPAALDQGRRRLEPVLPEPFVQLAISIGGGLPAHYAEAAEAAERAPSRAARRFADARGAAETAVRAFLESLKGEFLPRTDQSFALGSQRFQKLLWVREGLRTPFEEIRAQGLADLKRNRARLEEIARAQRPPTPPADLLDRMLRDHPSASELIPTARRFVDETREFLVEKALATLPEPASVRVEETPTYGRALSTASMNPPGPFDTVGDEGIYYVTPVDPTWPPERQEQWLRSFNRALLRNVTVHEVYPGHYLQFLHFRRSATTTARKVFLSSAFAEGWAHYCEQLAVEAGFGSGAPEAEVAQIHDALLRDVRLLASVGLHTGGMSVPEATRLFQTEAYFEELPAEREAIRGTFNPEYFCYTLGKLAILDVREKYLASRFGGSMRAFHDRLLGFGCPPVGALDRLFAAG